MSARTAPDPLPRASGDARGPLASAEFLSVDVETNGRAGPACEITEVGAVLVGGEMHDRFESLMAVAAPLSRGIQRFTGISQEMVDGAPAPEDVLPRLAALLRGRVLVAHSAGFDTRALRQGFERAGIRWPEPPVLCTVALARRFAPLARRRGLEPLAEALGIEVASTHRALVDAETCARVFCALFPRLCARAATVEDAVALLAPRARRPRGAGRRRAPEERPDLGALPDDPGVYVFRNVRGRALYVGKSVAVRSRARSHFCRPAGWTASAEVVDYRPTHSELGALVLENRLIKAWRPPGNVKLKRSDGYVFIRARLDIPYPILEIASEPAAGRAVSVGPLRGRTAAQELVEHLSSVFGLRHCGRALPRRDHPSTYGQMGRCLSPCLGDLDPNLYRRRLDEALAVFESCDADGRDALLARIESSMREASAAQRYERAAALHRRHERLAGVLSRLGGVLEATHARSRLVLAGHPTKPRFDAFWIVAGRVVDWGPLPEAPAEIAARTAAALERRPSSRTVVPAEEVDEVRIVAAWLAANEPPELELEAGLDPSRVSGLVERLPGAAAARRA
ncbi:MAG: exonuclease domain-containing protein [Thermoleophilaceae bacterium]